MIKLLAAFFIKSDNFGNKAVRQKYGIMCSVVGIVFNFLLCGGKFFAGSITGSIAITADALNNLSDAGASLITMLGFKLAGQEADRDHPFGHGRYEYIAGFVVSLIILIMAFELGQASVSKIINPQALEIGPVSVVILAVSVVVKLYMAYYNRVIGKKTGSSAMEATAKDSLSDAVATTAVLLSMVAAHSFGLNLDGWFGLLVAAFIAYTGITAARDTISPILGQPPDPALVKRVQRLVMSYSGVRGMHDLIVHDYGPGNMMITLHAEVSRTGDMLALHEVIDDIERRIQDEFHCQALVHMDPIATDDESTARLLAEVCALVAEIGGEISVHDFRIVRGSSQIKLIFDVTVPFGFNVKDRQLKEEIEAAVAALGAGYSAVVTIDKV